MNDKTKAILGIGSVFVIVFVIFGAGFLPQSVRNDIANDVAYELATTEQLANVLRNEFGSLSDEEIEEKLVDWNYRSILRDTAYYSDKLIKVSGTVGYYAIEEGVHTVGLDSSTESDEQFLIITMKKYLENDQIEVIGIVGDLVVDDWGEIPAMIAIKEKCLNC